MGWGCRMSSIPGGHRVRLGTCIEQPYEVLSSELLCSCLRIELLLVGGIVDMGWESHLAKHPLRHMGHLRARMYVDTSAHSHL